MELRKAGLTLLVIILCLLQLCSTQTDLYRSIKYTIEEEVPNGTQVGNVVIDAKLNTKYSKTIIHSLQFVIQESDQVPFEITNGLLRTSSRLDRDILCPGQENCTLSFDVTVQPPKYFLIIHISVTVIDINDHSPVFPNDTTVRYISEAAGVGTSIQVPTAKDFDSPANGTKDYKIVSGSQTFSLKEDTIGDNLYLQLLHVLDREFQDSYEVVIEAKDGGTPHRTGRVTVKVNILDINDDIPTFTEDSYTVTVPENLGKASLIQVKAIDNDIGPNGQVTYSLDQETSTYYNNIFQIDSVTGLLSTKQSLDREDKANYVLHIIARDNGPNSLPTQTTVTVLVADINDNGPLVSSNTGVGQSVGISEWAEYGDFVAHITVTDPDAGINGTFNCTSESDKFKLLHIYQGNYRLVLDGQIDREVQDIHNVTIYCADFGTPVVNSKTIIPVHILDENDQRPVFTQNIYEVNIPENKPVGQQIIQVIAMDNDIDTNAEVSYTLDQGVKRFFSINSTSGVIYAKGRLDYEQEQIFRFHVFARDHGVTSFSTNSTVIIHVTDVNDEVPLFASTNYSFKVLENQPLGTFVGRVSATDKDLSPVNSNIQYSIHKHKRHDILPFSIDPLTGEIKTKQPVDREMFNKYSFRIVAKDTGNPPLNSSVQVTVVTLDQNDNPPRIVFPSDNHHHLYITSFNSEKPVMKFRVDDPDTPQYAQHLFYLNNYQNLFKIDKNDGQLYLIREPTHVENDNIFQLNVTVIDSKQLSMYTYRILYLHLNITVSKGYERNQILFPGQNTTIVIILLAISAVLITLLTVSIIWVLLKRRRAHIRQNVRARKSIMCQNFQLEESSITREHGSLKKSSSDKKRVSFKDSLTREHGTLDKDDVIQAKKNNLVASKEDYLQVKTHVSFCIYIKIMKIFSLPF